MAGSVSARGAASRAALAGSCVLRRDFFFFFFFLFRIDIFSYLPCIVADVLFSPLLPDGSQIWRWRGGERRCLGRAECAAARGPARRLWQARRRRRAAREILPLARKRSAPRLNNTGARTASVLLYDHPHHIHIRIIITMFIHPNR
jgi:hypothetical protein